VGREYFNRFCVVTVFGVILDRQAGQDYSYSCNCGVFIVFCFLKRVLSVCLVQSVLSPGPRGGAWVDGT